MSDIGAAIESLSTALRGRYGNQGGLQLIQGFAVSYDTGTNEVTATIGNSDTPVVIQNAGIAPNDGSPIWIANLGNGRMVCLGAQDGSAGGGGTAAVLHSTKPTNSNADWKTPIPTNMLYVRRLSGGSDLSIICNEAEAWAQWCDEWLEIRIYMDGDFVTAASGTDTGKKVWEVVGGWPAVTTGLHHVYFNPFLGDWEAAGWPENPFNGALFTTDQLFGSPTGTFMLEGNSYSLYTSPQQYSSGSVHAIGFAWGEHVKGDPVVSTDGIWDINHATGQYTGDGLHSAMDSWSMEFTIRLPKVLGQHLYQGAQEDDPDFTGFTTTPIAFGGGGGGAADGYEKYTTHSEYGWPSGFLAFLGGAIPASSNHHTYCVHTDEWVRWIMTVSLAGTGGNFSLTSGSATGTDYLLLDLTADFVGFGYSSNPFAGIEDAVSIEPFTSYGIPCGTLSVGSGPPSYYPLFYERDASAIHFTYLDGTTMRDIRYDSPTSAEGWTLHFEMWIPKVPWSGVGTYTGSQVADPGDPEARAETP